MQDVQKKRALAYACLSILIPVTAYFFFFFLEGASSYRLSEVRVYVPFFVAHAAGIILSYAALRQSSTGPADDRTTILTVFLGSVGMLGSVFAVELLLYHHVFRT